MKTKFFLILALLTGVLLALSWPLNGFTPLIFVAFVPLLFVQQYLGDENKKGVFLYAWLGFFVWNVLTTWWIWNSTDVGSIFAFLLNAMFMAITFYLYHLSRKKLFNNKRGSFILVFYWLTFEYIHMNWDLTWSWLNLGNVFASKPVWIQWYEFTGHLGGSLWILVINILIFEIIQVFIKQKSLLQKAILLSSFTIVLIVPLIISVNIYNNYIEKSDPVKVVVVQPNTDPWNEQYNIPYLEILDNNLELALTKIDSTTDFVVFPESTLQEDIWERHLDKSRSLNIIKDFLWSYPNISIVIGATTYKLIDSIETMTNAARKFKSREGYYYAYNTAIFIEKDQDFQIHHKSKLTPGVEIMPSWWILKPIENLAIDLGGTTGTLGRENYPVYFTDSENTGISPIICYESVYGEFVSKSVRLGADLIFVITNDGWWGDTPGHRQHLLFSVLRAIETRRSVARSANTGISAFINQRGDIMQQTEYWKPDVIEASLNKNSEMTYYVKNGDFLGRISAFVAVLVLLISFVQGYLKKVNSPKAKI